MLKKICSSLKSTVTSAFVGSIVLNIRWKSYNDALISTAKAFSLEEVDIRPLPLKGWESINKNWKDIQGSENGIERNRVKFDFIVKSNGTVSDLCISECPSQEKYLKDFSDLNIKWIPGKKGQNFVNVRMTISLPVF